MKEKLLKVARMLLAILTEALRNVKTALSKLARMLLAILTEALRMAIISLILIFVFRFIREIIDPFLAESYRDAIRVLLDVIMIGGLYEAIKKIKSILGLLFMVLLFFILVLKEKSIIKFIQQKYEIPARQ